MRILLAEDEVQMSRAVTAVLKHSGYEVDFVYDGEAAVELASKNAYDCMIFDIMMPKKDGITALKEIRKAGNVTPVIMLTAKAETDDRVEGLDAGADDYLTKPFAMKELLARIRSILRRAGAFTPRQLKLGDLSLDTEKNEISCVNSIRLSQKESRLMEFLMLNAKKEFSTEELFRHIWDDDPDADSGIVWIYISYLKQKLSAISSKVRLEGEEDGSFVLSD